MVRDLALDEKEKELAARLFLLTIKPLLYVANVGENGFNDNPHLSQLQEIAQDTAVVAISAKTEAEISALPVDEQAEFLRDLGLSETGLLRLTRAAFSLLGLINYFTVGPKESRAWTIKRGENAKEAAGAIHTDFVRGLSVPRFVPAQII